MNQQNVFDLVVIGGGPAGYVGAIRAAQVGMSVVCVERDKLGGICLNWGCIPTKALLAGAELYEKLKHEAPSWGIYADNIRHDWSTVIGRSRNVAGTLNKGIHALFKKNKITHVIGEARIVNAPQGSGDALVPGHVEVTDTTGAAGAQTLGARRILIATGSVPRALPGIEFDGDRIISSKEAMSLPEQPKRLAIVGAGAIGMEFAYFYSAYGTEVTVIELMDRVLPGEDADVSKAVSKAFRKRGVDVRVKTKTLSVNKSADAVEVTVAQADDESKTETITADRVLVAVGVRGRFDGLFGNNVAIQTEKGHIKVDRGTYETSVPGIYAAGDVIGPPWLAHVASEEAVVCIEHMAGHHPTPIDYDAIPGCTYCMPQVASLGMTEQRCRGKGPRQGQGLHRRDVPLPGQRQSPSRRAHRRVRQAHHRRQARRDPSGCTWSASP